MGAELTAAGVQLPGLGARGGRRGPGAGRRRDVRVADRSGRLLLARGAPASPRRPLLAAPGRRAALPDPASRCQPEGPLGPSEACGPRPVRLARRGLARPAAREDQVIYELHVGTFTPEGTWRAAIGASGAAGRGRHHGDRADAGQRVPGRASAGATTASASMRPYHHYGAPDDLRAFVDAAHGTGPGRDPGRGLQPSRPRRRVPGALRRRPTSPSATSPTGARR